MTNLDRLRSAYETSRNILAAQRVAHDLIGRLTVAYSSFDSAAHVALAEKRGEAIRLGMAAIEDLAAAEHACRVAELRLDVAVFESMRDPSADEVRRLEKRRAELAALEGRGRAA